MTTRARPKNGVRLGTGQYPRARTLAKCSCTLEEKEGSIPFDDRERGGKGDVDAGAVRKGFLSYSPVQIDCTLSISFLLALVDRPHVDVLPSLVKLTISDSLSVQFSLPLSLIDRNTSGALYLTLPVQNMSKKIIVFGSVVHDLVSYTENFPRPGESVRGNAFAMGGGGKGANQAVAAARFRADVTFIGMVGDDIFGQANIDGLRKAGVNVDHVGKSTTASTATATIVVNKEGENTIVVTLGANLELTPAVAERMEDVIATGGILMAQAEISQEANRKAFELARKHGVKVFFNPAPGDSNLDKSLLSLVDIVCTNENEAEFITGITSNTIEEAKKAAEMMLKMGPSCAIVTMGAQGAVLATNSGTFHLPLEKSGQVVDTTGAGDCFCGTFCAHLMAQANEWHAAKAAATVAAISVQRKGTQNSYPTRKELDERGYVFPIRSELV